MPEPSDGYIIMRRLGVVGLQKPWLTKKQALTVQAGVPAKGQLIKGLVEGRLGDKLGLSREYPNPTRNPEPEPERRILLASTDTTAAAPTDGSAQPNFMKPSRHVIIHPSRHFSSTDGTLCTVLSRKSVDANSPSNVSHEIHSNP